MSPIPILLFFSILYFSLSSNPPPSAAAELTGDPPTAYDLLQSFGFPVGILPIGVKGYDLDKSTGKFNLYLNKICSFSLEGSYQLKYKSVVSGYISKNKLANISGVSVKVLFLWLNIVEVDRSDNDIDFSVGIAGASFPIENFLESPQCGCGFDCDFVGDNGLVRKMKFNPFVNSV